MKNYDGWAVKSKEGKLLIEFIDKNWIGVIREIGGEKIWKIWKKHDYKIVKVKLIEVE